jgi:outer membrane protein
VTAAAAENQTAIAAGVLQTAGLASRVATGVAVSQLVTDFGRTSKLTQSARFRAEAADETVRMRRAETILEVHQAYYAALRAAAVVEVAKATLESRRVILRQVQGLAASNLRSTLDVSFAEVAVSEADLLVQQAENDVREAQAALAAAMGQEQSTSYQLEPVSTLPILEADVDALVEKALAARPELKIARLNLSAAQRFAEAQHRSLYPSISITGAAGVIPAHQKALRDQYAAAAIHLTLPFLNGGRLSANAAEADLRARAAGKDTENLALQVALAVKKSWLDADTAHKRFVLTEKMVEQAKLAYRLASTRYENGLGGIVEVTQAQLAETSALIAQARARYDYLAQVSNLNFAMGELQ